MNISLKKLIGQCIYKSKNDEPWGKIKGICFSDEGNKVSSFTVETLSLIPLSTTVPIEEISNTSSKKLVLKSAISIGKGINGLRDTQISKVVQNDDKPSKIKDMRFNFETGEITDIVIEKGVFRKGEKISVNKMYIKDNTIYIE